MSAPNSRNHPSPNSYWVLSGRFAAGEYPGAIDDSEAADKLRILLDAGINHFINLTEDGEYTLVGKLKPYAEIAEEEASRRGLAIGYERHPIVDMSVPRSRKQMAAILDAIDAALNDGRAVYVHCWGGVGRTGTVVGCWLVRSGYTGDAALRRIAEWWQGMEKVHKHPKSPQRCEQDEYVRNWIEPPEEETS